MFEIQTGAAELESPHVTSDEAEARAQARELAEEFGIAYLTWGEKSSEGVPRNADKYVRGQREPISVLREWSIFHA